MAKSVQEVEDALFQVLCENASLDLMTAQYEQLDGIDMTVGEAVAFLAKNSPRWRVAATRAGWAVR